MKFSAKALYGLRVCYILGKNFGGESLSVSKIAGLADVSYAYLEKIMRTLKKDGLVTATMGVSGGYTLSRAPKDITIGQILISLEGDLFLSVCVANNCQSQKCPNKSIFSIIYESINHELNKLTLQDMLDKTTRSD